MKTIVEVRVEVEHETDSDYEMIMNQIENNIKDVSGVDFVHVGIGEKE